MPRRLEHSPASRPLADHEVDELAETLRGLGSTSRLRLLWALLEQERTVEDLAGIASLEPSATSHHLRILRSLRLVRARRSGRNVFYSLHDDHLSDLLAAVRHHHEHVHPSGAEPPAAVSSRAG